MNRQLRAVHEDAVLLLGEDDVTARIVAEYAFGNELRRRFIQAIEIVIAFEEFQRGFHGYADFDVDRDAVGKSDIGAYRGSIDKVLELFAVRPGLEHFVRLSCRVADLRLIRSDNGPEFVAQAVRDWLAASGVDPSSSPHTFSRAANRDTTFSSGALPA